MPNLPVIIFESDDWLVLNKPTNWHTLRPGQNRKPAPSASQLPNLEDWLTQNFPSSATIKEAGILQRLDLPTTGCLIVARSPESYQHLSPIIRSGPNISKIYLAVVQPGLPPQGEFELFFTSRYRRSAKITVNDSGDPQHRGICRWRICPAAFSEPQHTLLQVQIIGPGRRHQIRAGLAHLGYPLRGDETYAGLHPWKGGFGLHAYQIQFADQTITAPPPASWEAPADKLEESFDDTRP